MQRISIAFIDVNSVNNLYPFCEDIYIYAFSRSFYPKRLTFSLYICFYQYVCSLGIESTTFCAFNAMLYHWATGTTFMWPGVNGNVLTNQIDIRSEKTHEVTRCKQALWAHCVFLREGLHRTRKSTDRLRRTETHVTVQSSLRNTIKPSKIAGWPPL